MGSQHAALASGRICGPAIHEPAAACCAACAGAAGVVAGFGRYRGHSRPRRIRDSRLDTARFGIRATLVSDPNAGCGELRFLDRRLLRHDDYLAREKGLPTGGRTICSGGVELQSAQMPVIQRNRVIQYLSSPASDASLRNWFCQRLWMLVRLLIAISG